MRLFILVGELTIRSDAGRPKSTARVAALWVEPGLYEPSGRRLESHQMVSNTTSKDSSPAGLPPLNIITICIEVLQLSRPMLFSNSTRFYLMVQAFGTHQSKVIYQNRVG